MATRPLPDPVLLRQLLIYDPATGTLTWREGRLAGREAFTNISSAGYKRGYLLGKLFQAHRVILTLVNGREPPADVDHINGDKSDNRWVNLREATRSQNARNTKRRADNTTGAPGVHWRKDGKRWQVHACGQHQGYFDTFDEAVLARRKAEARMNFHQNHGRGGN